MRSTVDLLIDRPWKRERLIRQQAIPADNIRVVRSLDRETNISSAFVHCRNVRAQSVTAFPPTEIEKTK